MRVAVIGGGMAGLSAAHELLRRGAEPVVFESAARAGGKVGSHSERGWLTEDGPGFLARPLDALLEIAGLRGEVVRPAGPAARWVHFGGRVLRAPGPALLLRAGLARALLEPLFARPLREDLALREFLVQRLGARAGGLLASVMAAGVYAGDASRLSARDAFPLLGALGERGSFLAGVLRGRRGPASGIWSLRRGLGSLAEGAAAGLGGRLRLGAEIADLARARRGWQVAGEPFDAVILALPASRAAALLRPLSPAFAEAAGALQTAPVTVVHLGFADQGLPRGFGMLDADGSLHALGTLFPSSMLPGRAPAGRALLTAICGGAVHPERALLPDAELLPRVLADLRLTLGIRRDPEYVRVVRWTEGIPQVDVGHRDRVRAARALLAGLRGVELAGASWDGVGVPDVVRSGAAAAARVVDGPQG